MGKMIIRRILLTAVCSIAMFILLFTWGGTAQAGNGIPSSAKFGIGAKINPQTKNIEPVVRSASQIGFNWLAVEFDWTQYWPDPNLPIDLLQLTQAAQASLSHRTNLMITINNPPGWAMTAQGPNIQHMATLVSILMKSLPDNVVAIELIPGANSASHWGAPANPQYYSAMINQIQSTVMLHNPKTVVLASITPLGPNRVEGDMEDLDFLSALYQGKDQEFPVIGVNFSQNFGDPVQDPVTDPAHNLRHYEQVRKVMLDHGRSMDLIWITNFSWPASLVEYQDQSLWIYEAFKLLRTQLYIGAAFFTNLNGNTPETGGAFLITDNLSYHPASYMVQQIASNQVDSTLKSPNLPGQYQQNQDKSFLEVLWSFIRSWLNLP